MAPTARTPEERASEDVSVALPDDPSAARQSRIVVREALVRWGLTVLVDDAELAVSELVTNAVKHGLPPVVLTIRQREGSVRIDVTDKRPVTATIELALVSGDGDESGRGRGIVAAVSDQSGTEITRGQGKSSYASWDLDPPNSSPVA